MLDWLFLLGPWVPYALSALLVVVAAEVGRRVGKRRERHASSSPSDLSTLEASALGLLALMVGFTFSMTLSRYDARLRGSFDEANAIGTAALRADLLPEPQASEVKPLFRRYVEVRLELDTVAPTLAAFERAYAESNALQAKMWQEGIAASRAAPRSVEVVSFVSALNTMFDMQGIRVGRMRDRVPAPALTLLYAIAVVGVTFSGYAGALKKRAHLPVLLIGVLVAVIIAMIADFDRPKTGFIQIQQHAMRDLRATLSASP